MIVQEIVNYSGWASENALAVIVSGTGKRVAESYDGDSAGAALLIDRRLDVSRWCLGVLVGGREDRPDPRDRSLARQAAA